MSVKKARKIKDILFPLGVFFCFMGYIFAPLMYVGAAMAAAGLVVYILYCKCPECGRHTRKNSGDYCQYCGRKLE